MITGAQHDERMALRDHFRDVLTEAAKQRPRLRQMVHSDHGSWPEWLVHERLRMLHAVNDVLADRGLPGVLLTEIERLDQLATGCDWLDKFPWYCAELATSDMRR